jgi:hypothetical protein
MDTLLIVSTLEISPKFVIDDVNDESKKGKQAKKKDWICPTVTIREK